MYIYIYIYVCIHTYARGYIYSIYVDVHIYMLYVKLRQKNEPAGVHQKEEGVPKISNRRLALNPSTLCYQAVSCKPLNPKRF